MLGRAVEACTSFVDDDLSLDTWEDWMVYQEQDQEQEQCFSAETYEYTFSPTTPVPIPSPPTDIERDSYNIFTSSPPRYIHTNKGFAAHDSGFEDEDRGEGEGEGEGDGEWFGEY